MDKIFAYLDKNRRYVLIALVVFMGLMMLRWLVIDHYTNKLFSFFRDWDKVQEQPVSGSAKDQEAEQETDKPSAWIESYISELNKKREEVMRFLPSTTDTPHQVFIQERIDEQYRAVGKDVRPQYSDEVRLKSYEIVKPYAEFMDRGLNHLMKCGTEIEAGVQIELNKINKLSNWLEDAKKTVERLLLRKTLTKKEQEELKDWDNAIKRFDYGRLIDDRDTLLERVLGSQSICREDIKTLWPELSKDKGYVREYMPLLSRHDIEEYYYIIGKMY